MFSRIVALSVISLLILFAGCRGDAINRPVLQTPTSTNGHQTPSMPTASPPTFPQSATQQPQTPDPGNILTPTAFPSATQRDEPIPGPTTTSTPLPEALSASTASSAESSCSATPFAAEDPPRHVWPWPIELDWYENDGIWLSTEFQRYMDSRNYSRPGEWFAGPNRLIVAHADDGSRSFTVLGSLLGEPLVEIPFTIDPGLETSSSPHGVV